MKLGNLRLLLHSTMKNICFRFPVLEFLRLLVLTSLLVMVLETYTISIRMFMLNMLKPLSLLLVVDVCRFSLVLPFRKFLLADSNLMLLLFRILMTWSSVWVLPSSALVNTLLGTEALLLPVPFQSITFSIPVLPSLVFLDGRIICTGPVSTTKIPMVSRSSFAVSVRVSARS